VKYGRRKSVGSAHPSQLVGTQKMLGGRTLQTVEQVNLFHAVGRNKIGEDTGNQ